MEATLSDETHSSSLRVALVVGTACLLNPLNGTLIASSLSEIAQTFRINYADSSALLPVYLSCTAAFQPLSGAIGDRVGRRRTLLIGLLSFSVVSVAASQSTTFLQLGIARCLQACCTALVMPNAVGLLRDAVPTARQGAALGVVGLLAGCAAAVGFPLGAWLGHLMGWRPLFWISVPMGLLSAALSLKLLPEARGQAGPLSPLSWVGLPLLPLVLGVELLRVGDPDGYGVFCLAVAVVLAALVSARLRSTAAGRTAARGVGTRPFMFACLLILLQTAALYIPFLVLPTWLEPMLGLTRSQVGLLVASMIVAMVVVGPAAGRWSDRVGSTLPLRLGFGVASVGLLALVTLPSTRSMAQALAGLLAFGLGIGINSAPLQRLALITVDPRQSAVAMGLFQSSRFAGGIAGTSLVAFGLSGGLVVSLVEGQRLLALGLIAAILPGWAVSFIMRRLRGSPSVAPPPLA